MRYQDTAYARFMKRRIREKPGAPYLFIETQGPFRDYRGHYVGFKRLMKELHCGKMALMRILDEEGIQIYRVAVRERHWLFIHPDYLAGLIKRHGTPEAKEERMQSWRGRTPTNLVGRCPHCEKAGKLWQGGRTTAGNLRVQCGYCKRYHTRGDASKRLPPLQATCPNCGATTHQWRYGASARGNRYAKCGKCRKHYKLQGDPDRALTPGWVNPRRLTPEEEIAELRKRLIAGPSEWEIERHARRMLSEGEARSGRLMAEVEAGERRVERELAMMKALDRAHDLARAAFARRPPRPGEPPRMDPQTAWDWLSQARQEIMDEYLSHIPPIEDPKSSA